MEIGDSITLNHKGIIVEGDLTDIYTDLNGRVFITIDNTQSFYLDECDGLTYTPAYTRFN
jgi:hypothetical protein